MNFGDKLSIIRKASSYFSYAFLSLSLFFSCSVENKSGSQNSLKIITEAKTPFVISEPFGTLKLTGVDASNTLLSHGLWSVDQPLIASINSKTGLLKAKGNGVVTVSLFVPPDRRINQKVEITSQLKPIGNNISVHPDLNAVSMIIDWEDFAIINKGEFDLQKVTRALYAKFEDDFDFVFLISHNYGCPECPYAGRNTLVKNDIKGIGKSIYNSCRDFGSEGRLQSIIHITQPRGFSNGTTLHELMHRWGNYIVPSYSFDSQGNQKRDQSHWGVSDAIGVLGGFGVGKPENESATIFKANFGEGNSFSTNHNRTKYSPIELYLMGLIPEDEVPPLTIYSGLKCSPKDFKKNGTFSCNSTTRYLIKDIVETHGKRIPSYKFSQKEFKALAVILTTEYNPIRENEWKFYTQEIKTFCSRKNSEGILNFYQATGARAAIIMGDLDRSLKK
jgi:hypothetical protein